MPAYTPPLRDMRFVLFELLGADKMSELPGLDFATPDLVGSVLEEAGKFCAGVLRPLSQSGDREGATLENGAVRTPAGFPKAYELYRQGGWTGLACDPGYGGQGLPPSVAAMVGEMVFASNPGFDLYPGLIHGAYLAILHHASDELRQTWLPPLVEGRFTATMGLTEPQAGSDLSLTRSRAVDAGDGTYLITGSKMFTSGGDHDLAENIVHLVLARLPDAPPGTRGISLFLVPKLLAGNKRNAVSVGSIEHKMGMRASATCVMNYDGATGWLVGEANRGLACMFTMMNDARLMVGIQGVGTAEAAYQAAAAYAAERLQGRAPGAPAYPEKPADPLLVHPDVRRMLLTMRTHAEGTRALAGWVARGLDAEKHDPDPEARHRASSFVALMTPVVKALCTDLGHEAADIGMQVLGGHGYIADHGIEQMARDGRVTRIYEGANGIQALDLVRRKLPADKGAGMKAFIREVQSFARHHKDDATLAPITGPLTSALTRLKKATTQLTTPMPEGELESAATDYLRLFGLVALGLLWGRMAVIAAARLDDDPDGFYKAKLLSARFFAERILPQTASLAATIAAGSGAIGLFDEAAFVRRD